jgi:hypothetical protein
LKDPSLTILIASCESYSDLWRPSVALWRRNWPDCPYDICVGTDGPSAVPVGVRALRAEVRSSWSVCVLTYLIAIESEYVLFSLEDFFMRKRVINAEISRAVEFLRATNGHCLRLVPRPAPPRDCVVSPDSRFGVLPPRMPYRVSAQAAIWRRKSLMSVLSAEESAWEFEVKGSQRSASIHREGYFGVYRSILPYGHHVVERGKWFPWYAWYFSRQNIGCNLESRRVMGSGEASMWVVRKVKDVILGPMPKSVRFRISSVFRQVLKLT